MERIKPGDRLIVTVYGGEERPATAASYPEGTHDEHGRKIHDFPVVYVVLDGHTERDPWPLESVRPMPATQAEKAGTET